VPFVCNLYCLASIPTGAISDWGISLMKWRGIGIIHPCDTSLSMIDFRTFWLVTADLWLPLAMNSKFFAFLSSSEIGDKGHDDPLDNCANKDGQLRWCSNNDSKRCLGRNSDP
jgi:hypothetical protein